MIPTDKKNKNIKERPLYKRKIPDDRIYYGYAGNKISNYYLMYNNEGNIKDLKNLKNTYYFFNNG